MAIVHALLDGETKCTILESFVFHGKPYHKVATAFSVIVVPVSRITILQITDVLSYTHSHQN